MIRLTYFFVRVCVFWIGRDQSSSLTKVNKFKRRDILFEIQLTPTDVENGRFSIPVETALDAFLPLMTEASLQQSFYKKIKISIPTRTYTWSMAITYDPEECLFLIKSRKWQQFVIWHGFKPADILRLFKPFPVPACRKQSFPNRTLQ